jgi:hypothetical protein
MTIFQLTRQLHTNDPRFWLSGGPPSDSRHRVDDRLALAALARLSQSQSGHMHHTARLTNVVADVQANIINIIMKIVK